MDQKIQLIQLSLITLLRFFQDDAFKSFFNEGKCFLRHYYVRQSPPVTQNSNQSVIVIPDFSIGQTKKRIILNFNFSGIYWLQIKNSRDIKLRQWTHLSNSSVKYLWWGCFLPYRLSFKSEFPIFVLGLHQSVKIPQNYLGHSIQDSVTILTLKSWHHRWLHPGVVTLST